MADHAERLRKIDDYINKLYVDVTTRREHHTGQAHADINAIRHGLGAIPDGLLDGAAYIETLHVRIAALAQLGQALEKMEARCRRLEAKLVEIANRLPGGHPDRTEIINVVMEGE